MLDRYRRQHDVLHGAVFFLERVDHVQQLARRGDGVQDEEASSTQFHDGHPYGNLRETASESKKRPPSAFSDGDESRRWRNLARRPPHDTKPPQRAGPELADEGRARRRRD